MRITRNLGSIAGVLLILMLALGVQAATADVLDTNFQTDPGISSANFLRLGSGGSVLNLSQFLDLSLSRFKFSDEPIPATALLVLVGLIALIALKGRRK